MSIDEMIEMGGHSHLLLTEWYDYLVFLCGGETWELYAARHLTLDQYRERQSPYAWSM